MWFSGLRCLSGLCRRLQRGGDADVHHLHLPVPGGLTAPPPDMDQLTL